MTIKTRPGAAASGVNPFVLNSQTTSDRNFVWRSTETQSSLFTVQMKAGAIPYMASDTQFASDYPNFVWDATNHFLGIRTATPDVPLDIAGSIFRLGNTQYPARYTFLDTPNTYLVLDAGDTNSDASFVSRVQGNARSEIGVVGDFDEITHGVTQNIHFKNIFGNYLSETFSDWMIRRSDTRDSYFGYTDFVNSTKPTVGSSGDVVVRLFSHSSRASLVLGDATGPAFPGRFGQGLTFTFDPNLQIGFIDCATWNAFARDISVETVNNFRVSPGAVFANVDAVVIDPTGGMQVGRPIRHAAAGTISNEGAAGIATMHGYAPGDTLTPIISAGTAPTFPVTTTQASKAVAVIAAGTGGSPTPSTTLSATAAVNATTIQVASTVGFTTGDLVNIQLDGGQGFHETTIAGIGGNTLSLSAALPVAASAANAVYDCQGRVVTATTGTSTTAAQFTVRINNLGGIVQVLNIHNTGSYTVNPTNLANEPVTGASITGGALSITMGARDLGTPTNPGSLNLVPVTPIQTTSSGSGTGATISIQYVDTLGSFNIAQGLFVDGRPVYAPSIGISNPQVVYIGDSLTFGTPGTQLASATVAGGHTGHSYDHYINLPTYRGLNWSDTNVGIGGQSALVALAALPDNVERLFLPAAAANLALVWLGRNDISGGSTAATTYTRLTSIVTALKAFGWKVGLCTMISGSDDTGLLNTLDATLASLRTLINANTAGADFIVDLGANANLQPGLGTPAWHNTTYYQTDGIHLTDAGYSLVASIAQTALITYIGTLPTAHAWGYAFGGPATFNSDLTVLGTTNLAGLTFSVPLGTASGGTAKGTWTAGSVPFLASATAFGENNARLFWDNTNFRLGINTNAPNVGLETKKTVTGSGQSIFRVTQDNGSTAFDINSDSNRHQTVAVYDPDGTTFRYFSSSYYSTAINPANYGTTGGLDIGAAANNNNNGGYGVRIRKGWLNAALGVDGSTSGTLAIKAAAVAGSNTLTLPAGTTDFSATGGASQVLKQTSAGGALTVAQLAASDLSGGIATANGMMKDDGAGNITAGTYESDFGLPDAHIDLDFVNAIYWNAPNNPNTRFTVTRSTLDYVDDASGVWTQVPANTLRRSNKGVLIEEQRTNNVRNNSMQGAVAGTPGTPPTNWQAASPNNGLTRQIVGTGTSNGIDYVDIRYSGTTNNTFVNIAWETTTQIAATNGQTWSHSVFLALVGGNFTNITKFGLRDGVYSVTPTYLGELVTVITDIKGSLTGTLQRFTETGTIAFASAATMQPYVQFQCANGAVIDVTIRFGWPQLEFAPFVSSPIRTTIAAVTRAADVVRLNLPPSFGTSYSMDVAASPNAPTAFATDQFLCSVSDGTSANRYGLLRLASTGVPQWIINSTKTGIGAAAWAVTTSGILAGANAVSSQAGSFNGAAVTAGASATSPTGLARVEIGGDGTGASQFCGYITRLIVWPKTRLGNQVVTGISGTVPVANGFGAPSNPLAQSDLTSSGAAGLAQFVVRGFSTTSQELQLGYRTDLDYGFLQSAKWGVAFEPLALQPFGGRILLGTATDDGATMLQVNGGIKHASTTLLTTSVALTNGAAASTATLTNAPAVGNPTKWIPINDNGTTRYIPSW